MAQAPQWISHLRLIEALTDRATRDKVESGLVRPATHSVRDA